MISEPDTRGVPMRILAPKGGGDCTLESYKWSSPQGGRGLHIGELQMVLKPDTNGVHEKPDTNGVPARMMGPQGEWIVVSHIGWKEERNISYKGVVTSP